GLPSPGFGGAALPGVWNLALERQGTPNPLVGLDGASIGATVALHAMGDLSIDIPGTSADVEALYDDFGGGIGDVLATVTFDGLAPGRYEIIVHAWAPEALTTVMVGIESQTWVQTGGDWNGEAPQPGVTYGVLVSDVETTLDLGIVASRWGSSAAINGVQLVHRPCLADWDLNGALDIFDVLGFLGSFDEGAPIADLTLDGAFDIFDVLTYLDLYDQGC
ncbi:MAG: hypothetical protein KDA28_16675, partial [Phycisphaerales bacterium]|nr:hypothetical protein [Phycisphaerales bacterium]